MSLFEKESNKLKSWKTNPNFSRLKLATSELLKEFTFFPPIKTDPSVALSNVAIIFPLPDSPITAINSPFSTEKFTSLRASVFMRPIPP